MCRLSGLEKDKTEFYVYEVLGLWAALWLTMRKKYSVTAETAGKYCQYTYAEISTLHWTALPGRFDTGSYISFSIPLYIKRKTPKNVNQFFKIFFQPEILYSNADTYTEVFCRTTIPLLMEINNPALHFLIPSRRKERNPLSGLSLPPRASLPASVQNLFKKMVLVLHPVRNWSLGLHVSCQC